MNQLPSINQERFNKTIEHLKTELGTLRTGRASPSLVENIQVEAYDTKTKLIELASITTPETRQILIQPWDKSIIKEISQAIASSSLGLTPQVDGQVIRVNLPQLTEERRKELIKLMNGILENARVQVRNIREDVNKGLRNQEKEGKISEDQLFAAQKELQKIVDGFNEQIKKLGEIKEKEIMTI